MALSYWVVGRSVTYYPILQNVEYLHNSFAIIAAIEEAHMARVLGIFAILIVTASFISAQEKSDSKSPRILVIETTFKGNDSTEAFSERQSIRITNVFDKADQFSPSAQTDRPFSTPDQMFVVKDGQVRLSLSPNSPLIPVPGGGGSGCFNVDLHERIEKLKTFLRM